MNTERLTEDLLLLTRLLRPLRHTDMTPEQYWLLRRLQRFGPKSMSELAQGLGITTGSATVACKRLEKIGWVTRTRQIEDERVVLVALTEQGASQIESVREQRRASLAHLLEHLAVQEQQELQRLIEKLLEVAEYKDLEN
ncbi:MarR family winged helix-turn-helix transcriptional regulator [Dictyobacter arantiisoli]|uniref:HTH marR-type domain-containing protein n=1 Tax=Dictyobacter arantiisoli TaxID=2014874 RepID=A0A5A5TKM4_9CHLR|nr:MarR family transcriptional regulator [Dictyobacter arantiisoli]GCF11593.1 hypothetical protein KDI_51570 [Dictyobacter arantiisoli]